MTSKVFLVMTVYNRQTYLPLALDSILGQTYPHWLLTIWDDGSTDSSPEIARRYAQLDHRIQFIAAPHTGRQYALKDAISSNAQNYDYLAWVDSDDLLAPEALAATVAILNHHPTIGMVYTNHWIIDEQGKILGLGARCQIPYSKDRLLIDFMTFHFRLLRREIYHLVGGIDLTFPQAQDYDICLKISEVTEIYHLQQSLYCYRTHPDNISQTQKEKQVERAGTAVKNALVRRGLSEYYYLDILEGDQFKIVRRELPLNRSGN
jgi:glycosyltransferase involved in cell wall biosynthesis